MTEADLLSAILSLARIYGWRCAHFRPARTSRGWRTAMSGDVGWPDLLLVRGDRIVAAELKSDRGTVTQDQANWLSALRAGGVETYVWRPADWHNQHILTALRTAACAPVEPSLVPRDWLEADDVRRRALLDAGRRRKSDALTHARSTR